MTEKADATGSLRGLNSPHPDLFYKSHDASDKKLGDIVSARIEDYDRCETAIIGCPQDEGVKRNKGRVGAAEAPDVIRQVLYRLSAPHDIQENSIVDLGNVQIGKSLEETHDLHAAIVGRILQDGKKVIVLGGGNDISYPDCLALSHLTRNFLAFNIDSHFDVRDSTLRNSGTPYRQLLEEKILSPDMFIELAIQPFANASAYSQYLLEKGVTVYALDKLRQQGIKNTIDSLLNAKLPDAIFWGFDMDSVRSADAPGVSASYPTGLTAEEILSIASLAGKDKRTRIIEITEVNPRYDVDNRTAKLAALIIIHCLNT